MRALVVDDSKAVRTLLSKLLTELGFEVSVAGHGLEALRRLEETGPVDLALVDWNMPTMNGIEFVRAVRANAAFEKLRVMMITTQTETADLATALEAGADEYLMKPFTKIMVLEKLRLLGIELEEQ
jgi:two-component system, chemotaxis family, chemotaxis protein CheY